MAFGERSWERPSLRSVLPGEELPLFDPVGLSVSFAPFLPSFVREALRSGGAVRLAVVGREIVGLSIDYPAERTATVFGRTSVAVRALAALLRGRALFTELRLGPGAETYRLLGVDPADLPPARFRHSVRAVPAAEVPALLAGFRGAYGRTDDAWTIPLRGSDESAFVAAVDGRPAGIGWASVVGRHARLHSLWVAPGFRRLGVGGDLVSARLLWARAEGARSAISEIAAGNIASLATAARAGMRPCGEMYLRPAP